MTVPNKQHSSHSRLPKTISENLSQMRPWNGNSKVTAPETILYIAKIFEWLNLFLIFAEEGSRLSMSLLYQPFINSRSRFRYSTLYKFTLPFQVLTVGIFRLESILHWKISLYKSYFLAGYYLFINKRLRNSG